MPSLQPAQRPPSRPAIQPPSTPPARAPLAPRAPVKPSEQPPAKSSAELVKDQFRARFRRQLLLIAIMFPAVLVAKLDSRDTSSPSEIAGLAVFFVGFVLTLINWRCPQCNRYLYRRIYPSACPRCGVTFHD